MLAEAEALGVPRKRLRRDDRRLDLRLLPFRIVGISVKQCVGHDEAEHRVAEELERFVVDDAAREVLGRARAVRERVLEQPPIPEPIADARLQVLEFVAQPHDAAADLVAMRVDDPRRLLGRFRVHGDPDLAERVHRHGENRLRVARHADAVDAVALEERHDDAGLDVGARSEDDNRLHGSPAIRDPPTHVPPRSPCPRPSAGASSCRRAGWPRRRRRGSRAGCARAAPRTADARARR